MFFRLCFPYHHCLRLKLIQLTHLVYCKPLAISIVLSLEKRFNFIFDLELTKSKPFILSAISHPKFKLSWVPARFVVMCRKLFITECNLLNSVENSVDDNGSEKDENSDQDFFQILSGDNSLEEYTNRGNTNLASVQALSYFDTKKKNHQF